MQHPIIPQTRVVLSIASVLGCALLGLAASPLHAQENGGAASQKMEAVHFWAAGHTLPLRVAAQFNGQETYVPLTALEAVGAQFRLINNGNGVRVTGLNRREEDIPLAIQKGIGMIPLSTLARVVDGFVETSASDTSYRGATIVYLLARVTDARFENGVLHVRTSFPVPFQAKMLPETKPTRGYVDCIGAKVAENFRPAPLPNNERQALRVRTGQNSQTTARVVVDMADGTVLRAAGSEQGMTETMIAGDARPGRGNDVARGSQGKLVPPVPTPLGGGPNQGGRPDASGGTIVQAESGGTADTATATPKPLPVKPAARPVEVRGLNVSADGSTAFRFDVATGSKVRPIVRYSPGTTQMLVDIPNSQLALQSGGERDRSISHPLISGVRLETIQGSGAPLTRMTLDTARILGYSLNVQQDSFTLELRLPRNATGALSEKVIVIDAGHGGAASGATAGGVYEKDCTLGIAMKVRAELESLGARVVMTRTRDVDVSLSDRSRMGNEIGADLFVSIHNDSNGRSNSASGTSTYFHGSEPSARALAACVQQAVMAVTGLPSRGILSDTVMYNSGFAVLRGSAMPAVLCEVAYINNENDRRKLVDSGFQQRVAKAICDGLRTYVEGRPRRTASAARPLDRDRSESDENHSGF